MKKILSISLLSLSLIACSTAPTEKFKNSVSIGKITNVSFEKVTAKPALITVLAGAAVGGAVGHQFGNGSGKKWATGLGAVAGGAITDEALTKQYNQVKYSIYLPNTNESMVIVSPNVTSNIKDNDLVVVYQKDKKIKIDAYGTYTEDKFIEIQKRLAAGLLEWKRGLIAPFL